MKPKALLQFRGYINPSKHVGGRTQRALSELEVSGDRADAARTSLRVGWPAPDGPPEVIKPGLWAAVQLLKPQKR